MRLPGLELHGDHRPLGHWPVGPPTLRRRMGLLRWGPSGPPQWEALRSLLLRLSKLFMNRAQKLTRPRAAMRAAWLTLAVSAAPSNRTSSDASIMPLRPYFGAQMASSMSATWVTRSPSRTSPRSWSHPTVTTAALPLAGVRKRLFQSNTSGNARCKRSAACGTCSMSAFPCDNRGRTIPGLPDLQPCPGRRITLLAVTSGGTTADSLNRCRSAADWRKSSSSPVTAGLQPFPHRKNEYALSTGGVAPQPRPSSLPAAFQRCASQSCGTLPPEPPWWADPEPEQPAE